MHPRACAGILLSASVDPAAGERVASSARRLRRCAAVVLDGLPTSKGGPAVVAKDLLLVVTWVVLYAASLYLGSSHPALPLLLALPLAFSLAGVMFGVMHDGSHGAVSHHRFVNRLASLTLLLGGASTIGWHQEHVVRHHGRTNSLHEDPDLDTGGLLRFHPSQPWHPLHRWQRWYAPLLYALVTLRWIWFEDFDDVARNRFAMSRGARLRHALEVGVAKICHVLLFLLLPGLLWGWAPMLAFYVLHMAIIGVLTALTFVVAHVGDAQSMYDDSAPPGDWAQAQLASTANFSVDNRLLGWFLGGLNFQIEHHLFPAVSPRHYPRLLPVVRQWAADEGLPYHVYPTVRAALGAHFRHLRDLSHPPTT